MKNKILAGVCLLGLFAAAGATGIWPDGSAMDAWFADKSPVDEAKLGRQYFASQMLGAKANVPELQTKPLQLAIDWIASQGGGVLVLGPGVWNTSALFFKPGVHLKLEKGAVLRGPEDGSVVPRGMTHFVGHSFVYTLALINADACNGFTIYGEGTIDGNGKKSWIDFWKKRKTVKGFKDWDIPRPRNIYVSNSRDVRISGVTIKDSHFWTVQFYKCERVKVDNVRITAPGHKTPPAAPSSDAIDLDAVKDAHVEIRDEMTATEIDKMERRISKNVYEKHKLPLTSISIYAMNTSTEETKAIRAKVNEIVMGFEGVLQTHGFRADPEERTITMDIILDFDVKDRKAVFENIRAALQKAFPDYTLQLTLDIDF